jgi:Membrane protein TerC, possibly involved in tellurium resistance
MMSIPFLIYTNEKSGHDYNVRGRHGRIFSQTMGYCATLVSLAFLQSSAAFSFTSSSQNILLSLSSTANHRPRATFFTPNSSSRLSIVPPSQVLSNICTDANIHCLHSQKRNSLSYRQQRCGQGRTSLRLTTADENNTSITNSDQTKKSSILEPGSGPTIIIEPDETSAEIYSAAIKRTSLWVLCSIIFGVSLNFFVDAKTSEEFFAGYLLEQSLSVDNLLVFLLLFDYFKIPLQNQDRVLNFGIYGAVVMRAVMIGLGSVALQKIHAVLLVFAAILIYSSVTVLFGNDNEGDEDEKEDMDDNKIVQLSKNLFDASETFDGDRFFIMEEGKRKATPLFICMVAVEISDIVFAVDSIPAVFGVTEVRC